MDVREWVAHSLANSPPPLSEDGDRAKGIRTSELWASRPSPIIPPRLSTASSYGGPILDLSANAALAGASPQASRLGPTPSERLATPPTAQEVEALKGLTARAGALERELREMSAGFHGAPLYPRPALPTPPGGSLARSSAPPRIGHCGGDPSRNAPPRTCQQYSPPTVLASPAQHFSCRCRCSSTQR